MTLTANLDSLINVRNTNEYSKAQLTYLDEFGIEQKYQIKVRPRGKFRRRVCDMPPLKIKFSKKELEAAGLSKHNDLKLVTHCLDEAPYNERLVLREYLAYKLFNELTPYSYQVQLVHITYRNQSDGSEMVTQYGFLIEDTDEMAERVGGEECDDCLALDSELFQASSERIASLFQFMIGNTDWNMEMNRNVKIVAMDDGTYVPVPYDFDYSVMVSAPYMRPNIDLNQTPKMERIFLGNAASIDDLYGTMAYFKTKREAMMNVVRNFEWLPEEERNGIRKYLNSFFDNLSTKETAHLLIFKGQG